MYRTINSHADASLSVNELAETAIRIKSGLSYSDQDARTVALNNIEFVARASQLTLNLLDSWVKGDESIRQAIPQMVGLKTVTKDGVQYAGDCLEKVSRLSLVLLSQFQIEALLKNIHRELGLDQNRRGFYNIATDVLTALALPANDINILNTPARIRNSLHGNGVHHRIRADEPAVVSVGGVDYEFRDGQRVTCAGWSHVAHALEQSLLIIETILQISQVQAFPDPMFEAYAWDMATKPA